MIPSLRDELTGASRPGLPPFVLLLPRGWASVPPTREAFSDLAARTSAVLRSAHRPDLDAQFRSILDRAAEEFLRREPVRLIYPADVPADELFPLSITAIRLTAPGGGPLDPHVVALRRDRGARTLGDDGVLLRWEEEHTHRVPGGEVSVRSFDYLVAVPGTQRCEALLFSAVVPSAAAGERLDDETVRAAGVLADAIMSTFRWSGA
ncbi:hypothetical protein [Agromyces luteolus]|uniref:Uncharacterized protein n=1 Tax=Agromyces luteolus TaxID=88373 RepID=A0A7C9LF56_9MICO|nr:hypothetical protein [Agromyces luteolus]MUN07650.1 hypothetical protein [Agromyces luteolus]